MGISDSIFKAVTEKPIQTALGLGVASVGTGMVINRLMHPVDTAKHTAQGVAMGIRDGAEIAEGAGYGLATAAGIAAVGAAGYGANKVYKKFFPKAAPATPATPVPKVPWTPGRTTRLTQSPGWIASKAVGGYKKFWESAGPLKMFSGAVALGAAYSVAKEVAKIGLNAPTYESVMARSTEGSAYEDGGQAFGRRTQNSKLRTLGESARGLVGGLHNAR